MILRTRLLHIDAHRVGPLARWGHQVGGCGQYGLFLWIGWWRLWVRVAPMYHRYRSPKGQR